MEDDRVAILEAQLAEAKRIAEETDKKYDEVRILERNALLCLSGDGTLLLPPLPSRIFAEKGNGETRLSPWLCLSGARSQHNQPISTLKLCQSSFEVLDCLKVSLERLKALLE